MSQSAIPTMRCFSPTSQPLTASFDGPQLTSDGGPVWLAEADATLGLCAALTAHLPEWRTGSVHHSLKMLVRQRIFQIACGYEDQDDADTLRSDPLLKLVCGRLPGEPDLASQPTLSRFENAVDYQTCYRLAQALFGVYLVQREQPERPTQILIDADSTDDPTYGDQEGSAYHGYYGQHMYHPLLLFDGETDQLMTAILRPGTAHASHGIVGILKRVERAMQARWPGVQIAFRGDSGFAIPALYDYLEDQGITYTIGLATNSRLEALAAPQLEEALKQQATTGQKVRTFGETPYAAGSWPHERRVIIKTELLAKGPNVRFVVTTRDDEPDALYTFYIQRGGGPELWIKDLKDACFADRLSDHTFWANQFRLLLHAGSYWLLDTIRRWLMHRHMARMQLDTLRLWLLKVGGWVRQHFDGLRLHLASSHPGEPLWQLLADRPQRLMNN